MSVNTCQVLWNQYKQEVRKLYEHLVDDLTNLGIRCCPSQTGMWIIAGQDYYEIKFDGGLVLEDQEDRLVFADKDSLVKFLRFKEEEYESQKVK